MKALKRLRRVAWIAAILLVAGCGLEESERSVERVDGGSGLADGSAGPSSRAGDRAGTGGGEGDASDPWRDSDGDGRLDRFDNCPETPNRDQEDTDGDGVGDACDNRPECANRTQETEPCDQAGYDPDRDSDGDGVQDVDDNCPDRKNSDQKDADGDGVGDACDNCPDVPNSIQEDADGDGTGDACARRPAGEICRTKSATFAGLEPNIYFVLDTSASMQGTPLREAKRGLDQIVRALAPTARLGLTNYPEGGRCGSWEQLELGSHGVSDAQRSYADLEASGSTPTGTTLYHLRDDGRLEDPSDPNDDKRPKAVVVITDGDPNVCEGLHSSGDEARKLRQQGINTYVVGFKQGASPYVLNRIAKAGGTDAPGSERYYEANNTAELVKALQGISSKIVPCTFELDASPPDPNRIWVEVDGDYQRRGPSGDFTYDSSTNTVELSESACQRLRSAASKGSTPMTITFGCPAECESSEEICDGKDNDCDGQTDEGCDACEREVCDGEDNDCDGEIDEGCCPKKEEGESCSNDGDCCNGHCTDDGVCGEPCRPIGVVCLSDSQCCSGTCAKTEGELGSCISG